MQERTFDIEVLTINTSIFLAEKLEYELVYESTPLRYILFKFPTNDRGR